MKPLNIACLMTYEMSMFSDYKKQNWLVVWNITCTNLPTLESIVPTNLQMFQRDLNHQPDMRLYCLKTVLRVTWVCPTNRYPGIEWFIMRCCGNYCCWESHIFRGIQMAGMVCSWVYCNVKVLDKKQNAKPNICYEGRMFDTAWPGAGWMNV